MPGTILPHRYSAKDGFALIAPATFSSGVYIPKLAVDLYVAANIFGPCREVKISDPVVKMNQTAIGDGGAEERMIRRGTWEVQIEALIDAAGGTSSFAVGDILYGDARLRTLQHTVVDFLIMGGLGFIICQGVANFEGSLDMPMASGDNVIRGVRLTRRYGDPVNGDLHWANLATGGF